MHLCRRILLAFAVFGLQIGLAAAQPLPAPRPDTAATYLPETVAASAVNPAQRRGIIAGVGLYLVQPYFERNPGYTVVFENKERGTPPEFALVDRVDVSHHMQAAPQLWLGYIGENGLGGRGRYWYFRQGTSQSLAFPASTGASLTTVFSATPLGLEAFGDTLFSPPVDPGQPQPPGTPEPTAVTITSKLEVQVGDVEVLQDIQVGSWDFLFAGGIRIARIAQTYNFYNLQPTATPLVLRNLLSSSDFNGAGPVLAMESRRSLGGSGLGLYGSGRGALLFGSSQQNVLFGGTRLRNEDPNPQIATEHRSRALPVVELEVGLEYGRDVGRSILFGQIALVGQNWIGAGSASRSSPNTFKEGDPLHGSAADSDFGFFGLACRMGMNY